MNSHSTKRLQTNSQSTGLIALILLLNTFQPVFATPDSDLNLGMAAYNTKNFKVAAAYLQRATDAGLSSKAAWMYLGHSYTGIGDTAHAIEAYSNLISNFRGTPEAAQASKYLNLLDPQAAKKAAEPPAPKVIISTKAVEKKPYKDRIVIVPPLKRHPAVSKSFVTLVKVAVANLPPQIYKVLDEGGAMIFLAPNIEDKWPNSGDGLKPDEPNVTMGEEPGRTYGHDSYVYERQKVRNSDELGPARSPDQILHNLYHQIGHATDDCLGIASATPAFKTAFREDLENVPLGLRINHAYYFGDRSSAFAEIVGGLAGSNTESAKVCIENLPKCKYWIRKKLGM